MRLASQRAETHRPTRLYSCRGWKTRRNGAMRFVLSIARAPSPSPGGGRTHPTLVSPPFTLYLLVRIVPRTRSGLLGPSGAAELARRLPARCQQVTPDSTESIVYASKSTERVAPQLSATRVYPPAPAAVPARDNTRRFLPSSPLMVFASPRSTLYCRPRGDGTAPKSPPPPPPVARIVKTRQLQSRIETFSCNAPMIPMINGPDNRLTAAHY